MSSSPQQLLAEARWLEALARQIVGDPALAQDLVQDVWVASLEHGPRDVRNPRTWLAVLLRNALRRERRSSSARRGREISVARPEAHVTTDVVARAEAQRRLVDSVLALDEPWRSTVLWHYFDGLSCADIARREGQSASTVRNRLSRALEMLRVRLEGSSLGEHGLGGIVLLVPEWRAHLGGATAGVKAASIGGIVSGGLLMGVVVKVTAVMVACAGLAWWLWPTATPVSGDVPERPAQQTNAQALEGGETATKREPLNELVPLAPRPSDSKEHTAPAAAAAPESPLPPDVIEGIVLEDGVPWTRGGHVEWLPNWRDDLDAEPAIGNVRMAQLREDGTFRLDGVDLRATMSMLHAVVQGGITANAPVYGAIGNGAPPGPRPGRRVALNIGSATLTGHVWDEEGVPRAHSRVRLTVQQLDGKAVGPSGLNMDFGTWTDESGQYTLAHLPAGRGMGIQSDKLTPAQTQKQHFGLTIERGRSYTYDFGVPHPWPTWTGTVNNRARSPVRGVTTVILRDREGKLSYRAFKSEADGRFRARVAPGAYGVWVELEDLYGGDHEIELGGLEVGEIDLQHDLVVPGTRFTGRALTAEGNPVDGIANRMVISLRVAGSTAPSSVRTGVVASDGRFSIDGVEPGTYVAGAYPLQLAAGLDALQVIVRAEDVELVRDLVVVAR